VNRDEPVVNHRQGSHTKNEPQYPRQRTVGKPRRDNQAAALELSTIVEYSLQPIIHGLSPAVGAWDQRQMRSRYFLTEVIVA